MEARMFLLTGLLAVGAAPCASLPDPEAVPHGESPAAPPGVCLQLSSAQLLDLALRVGAAGVAVETPCLEVFP